LPAASKLDLRNIMAQDDAPKHSGIALGLQLESIATAKKLSQKERKKQQLQAHTQSSPEPAQLAPSLKDVAKNVAGPAWKNVSSPKLPVTAATAATVAKSRSPGPAPNSHGSASASASSPVLPPPRRSTTPQLTMQQTIAGPHSVRHHHGSKRTESQAATAYSLANIQYLQAAEKEQIKEFAAPRSLQDIQQQQTFEEWFEEESRRVQAETEVGEAAAATASMAGEEKGRRGRRGGGGDEGSKGGRRGGRGGRRGGGGGAGTGAGESRQGRAVKRDGSHSVPGGAGRGGVKVAKDGG